MFDPDCHENPVKLLNSSLTGFIRTFHLLDAHLNTKYEHLPVGIEQQLHAIDPETYPNSDWRLLVEELRKFEASRRKR